MQGNCFDTVIISDLHLGSEVSQAGAALAFLQSIHFKRLILLGDIFADLNFRRLTFADTPEVSVPAGLFPDEVYEGVAG